MEGNSRYEMLFPRGSTLCILKLGLVVTFHVAVL